MDRLNSIKKGQAASEFIFTYGYALAGAIVILSVIAYANGTNLDIFQKDYCKFYSGINCLDFTYNGTNVIIILQNEIGYDIADMNLSMTGKCNYYVDLFDEESGSISLRNGERYEFIFNCTYIPGVWLEDLNLDFMITKTNNNYTKKGEMRVKTR